MGNQISSSQSIAVGIVLSLLVGLIPAVLVYFALNVVNETLAIVVALVALGAVASAMNKSGYLPYTSPGTVGLDTSGGKMTGKVRGSGFQWTIPGLGGQIPLNEQERNVSPRVFTQLVGKVPVEVEILATAKIVNPTRYFQAQESGETLLPEFIETQARSFMGSWKDAGGVILQKDLLAQYLKLPTRANNRGEWSRFEAKLLDCTIPTTEDATPDLPPSAVKALMDSAGEVREQAELWGFDIGVVETKHFDLPKTLQEVGALALINTKRSEMIAEIKRDHKEIPEQDILNSVDMLLKLPITKSVAEFQMRDLDQVAAVFSKTIAELLFRFVKNTGGK